MLNTRRPLEEKLTLFWHGHFATGNTKVRDTRMMEWQNKMLREHANGRFRDLLLGILTDPAMTPTIGFGPTLGFRNGTSSTSRKALAYTQRWSASSVSTRTAR